MSSSELPQDTDADPAVLGVFMEYGNLGEHGSFNIVVKADRSVARKGLFVYASQTSENDEQQSEYEETHLENNYSEIDCSYSKKNDQQQYEHKVDQPEYQDDDSENNCYYSENDEQQSESESSHSEIEDDQIQYADNQDEHKDEHSDNDGDYFENSSAADQEHDVQNSCMDAEEDPNKIDWMSATPGQPRRYANTEVERAAAHRQWKAYHVEKAAAWKKAKREAAIICENKAKLRKLTARQQRRLDNERLMHGGKRPPTNYVEPESSSDEDSETEEPAVTISPPSVQKSAQLSGRIPSSDQLSSQAQKRAEEIERQIAALYAEKESLFTAARPISVSDSQSPGQDIFYDPIVSRRSQNRRKRSIEDSDDDDDVPRVKKAKRNSSSFKSSPALQRAGKSISPKMLNKDIVLSTKSEYNASVSAGNHALKQRKRSILETSDDEAGDDFQPMVKKVRQGNGSSRKSLPKAKYENASDPEMTDDEHVQKVSAKPKVAKPVAKRAIAPASGRPGTWTDVEHDSLELEIRNLRKEEASNKTRKPLRDMGLFNHVSVLLSRNHRITRNGGACKNYWNRYGRARAGFDERGKVEGLKRDLVTSSQGPKKR